MVSLHPTIFFFGFVFITCPPTELNVKVLLLLSIFPKAPNAWLGVEIISQIMWALTCLCLSFIRLTSLIWFYLTFPYLHI